MVLCGQSMPCGHFVIAGCGLSVLYGYIMMFLCGQIGFCGHFALVGCGQTAFEDTSGWLTGDKFDFVDIL